MPDCYRFPLRPRLTATGSRFDRGYYNLCQEAVKARPIDVWFSAPGKKLITDNEGAVIGVIINKDGTDVKIKVNGGVVLACGGFEHNQEMVSSYLQMPYVHQQGGLYNDGDGIKMALGAGADLWHMSNSAGFTWTHKRPHLDTVSLFGYPPRPYLHRRTLDLHAHAPAGLPGAGFRPAGQWQEAGKRFL